jgi:hypothetical protein
VTNAFKKLAMAMFLHWFFSMVTVAYPVDKAYYSKASENKTFEIISIVVIII